MISEVVILLQFLGMVQNGLFQCFYWFLCFVFIMELPYLDKYTVSNGTKNLTWRRMDSIFTQLNSVLPTLAYFYSRDWTKMAFFNVGIDFCSSSRSHGPLTWIPGDKYSIYFDSFWFCFLNTSRAGKNQ